MTTRPSSSVRPCSRMKYSWAPIRAVASGASSARDGSTWRGHNGRQWTSIDKLCVLLLHPYPVTVYEFYIWMLLLLSAGPSVQSVVRDSEDHQPIQGGGALWQFPRRRSSACGGWGRGSRQAVRRRQQVPTQGLQGTHRVQSINTIINQSFEISAQFATKTV